MPLRAMQAFEAAGRHMSMSLAAEELSVTQSAVSHQVRHLEDWLGQRLFDREQRQLRLTAAGARLLRVVSDALESIRRETSDLDLQSWVGKVCIAAPPSFATLWLVPRLLDLFARFPDLEVHLKTMPVPIPAKLPQADLVVQFGKHHWPGMRVLPLVEVDYLPVCAPQSLYRDGSVTPDRLAREVLIHDDDGEAWARWLAVVGLDGLQPARHVYADKSLDALELARLGVGFAINDHIITSNWLARGELVQAFPQRMTAYDSFYLVTAREDDMPGAILEIENWLRQAIRW